VLWLRGLIFTALAPGVVAVLAPALIRGGRPLSGGFWNLGWIPVLLGACVYLACLLKFLAANGTPAIFFTRRLRRVIGEEPAGLVCGGLYGFSRNPMYVGVLAVVFGQAILFSSLPVAIYGLAGWLAFHLSVVFLEEPHLRAKQGAAYDEYCRLVPRWFGRPPLLLLLALVAPLAYLAWVFAGRHAEPRVTKAPPDPEVIRRQAEIDRIYNTSELRILQFYSPTGELMEGEHALVCYGVLNAASVRIEPPLDGVGVSVSRCVTAAPTVDTRYTLTATGKDGSAASQSLVIKVIRKKGRQARQQLTVQISPES
jgi:protein-S-isoprenylcysteine O-methyltransferase Ste14